MLGWLNSLTCNQGAGKGKQVVRAGLTGLVLFCTALAGGALAQGFKFSNTDPSAGKAGEAEQRAKVQAMLDTPCRDKIKNQKIMVLIAESRNGAMLASQASYGPHFETINTRLRELGLKTSTQAEIRQQVAQAEIDAVFKNNPDAAISASRRLAAQYILRGLISSQAGRNLAVNVNQVSVSLSFNLTGANGRLISQAEAENASYAGQDTSGMALTLIKERAEEIVARLYSDFCQKAASR